MRRQLRRYDQKQPGVECCKFQSFGSMSKWEGKPMHVSHYA